MATAGCVAIIAGVVVLTWLGLGVEFLFESVAHGDSLIFPVALLVIPVTVVVGVVLFALPWLRRRGGLGLLLTLLVSGGVLAVLTVGITNSTPVRRPDTAIVQSLGGVCAGQGVAGAAAYRPGTAGPHPLVILAADGSQHEWTGYPEISWRPASLGAVELVACVAPKDEMAVLEVCEYRDGPAITRSEARRAITVVEARTGDQVASFVLVATPRDCAEKEAKDLTTIDGAVTFRLLEARLAGLVAAGSVETPLPESSPTPGRELTPVPSPTRAPRPTASP